MNKKVNKIILCFLFMVAVLVSGKASVQAAKNVDTGKCGKNATFTLDSEGLLTVKGKGKIEEYAFSRFYEKSSSIQKVEIQKGITEIGDNAFSFCENLKSVTISEGVTVIGKSAFKSCKNLTSIDIPESVTIIDRDAFLSCTWLYEIKLPKKMTYIGERAFSCCENISEINIPEGITEISSDTFSKCTSLKSISFPKGIKTIGNNAFHRCSALQSITFEEGLETIGKKAFYYCPLITEIRLPNSVYYIGEEAFRGWDALEKIETFGEIKEDTKKNENRIIDDSAFSMCNNLTEVTIPKGINVIGKNVFSDKKNLKKVKLHDDIIEIQDYAFSHCENLSKIDLSDGITKIGEYAFNGCIKIKTINIPKNITAIESGTFIGCNNLESIDIPENVKTIGRMAFRGCEKLKKVTFPDGLLSIEENAFLNCSKLKEVKLAKDVELGQYALGYTYNQEKYKFSSVKGFKIKYKNVSANTKYKNVKKLSAKNASIVLSQYYYAYDGSKKKPDVIIRDEKGNLISQKYYSVTYKNNKNVGKAKAVVTLKGKYSGTLKKEFEIRPSAININKIVSKNTSISISWNPLKEQVSGYQLQYANDKQFKINKKTITISDEKSSSKEIANLSNKEGYFFRMRSYKVVDKKKIYSDWMEFPEYITLKTKAYGQTKKEYLKKSTFSQGYIYLENIGTTIPILDKFNSEGLKENDNWFGGTPVGNLQTIAESAQTIMNITGYGIEGSPANGFTISEYYIEWAYADYLTVNDLSLKRDTTNGYYVLEINTPLDVDIFATKDIAPISRDLVMFICSTISSTPQTLYDYIYKGLYEDASILNTSKYKSVGDCQVKFDKNFWYSEYSVHCAFYIKAK